MKRLVLASAVLAFSVAAAGCGSSSNNSSGISGTIAGAAYTSSAELSLVASGNACTISTLSPVPVGVTLAEIAVTDVAATCSNENGCLPNARILGLVIARAKIATLTSPSTDAPGFATGSYGYLNLADMASFDPTHWLDSNGNLPIFTGQVVHTDAVCGSPTEYLIASGTLSVTSVSGNTISGTVTVNLVTTLGAPAGTLSGSFTTSTNCTPTPAPSACDILNNIIPT